MRLSASVGPPLVHETMWWMADSVRPGWSQWPTLAAPVAGRHGGSELGGDLAGLALPTSTISERPRITTRRTDESHSIRSMVARPTGWQSRSARVSTPGGPSPVRTSRVTMVLTSTGADLAQQQVPTGRRGGAGPGFSSHRHGRGCSFPRAGRRPAGRPARVRGRRAARPRPNRTRGHVVGRVLRRPFRSPSDGVSLGSQLVVGRQGPNQRAMIAALQVDDAQPQS